MVTSNRRHLKRNTLNRADIVQCALEQTASVGLEGLSMRLVSDALSCTPMAVYRHVRNKEELVDLVADAAVEEINRSRVDGSDWQESLRSFTYTARSVYGKYRGLSSYFLSHPATPAGRDIARYAVQLLVDAGADRGEALLMVGLLGSFVRGHLAMEQDATDHPDLFGDVDPDEQFEYGLTQILTMFEARLDAASRPGGKRSRR